MQLDENTFVRLRPDLKWVDDEDKMILSGDVTLVFHHVPQQLRRTLHDLAAPNGVAGAQLKAADCPFLALSLAHLTKLELLQIRSGAFSAVHGNTSAYFDATLGRPDAQSTLADIGIAVIGCGGIGGELLRHLVASGVRRLWLMDDDVVTQANLNRQYLFSQRQLGQAKTEAAKAALSDLCSEAEIATMGGRVTQLRDLSWLDTAPLHAIVCCADVPPRQVRNCISEYAERRQVWFACASVGIFRGHWGPVIPPGALPYHRWPWPAVATKVVDALQPPVASFGPTNSVVSAFLARDLMHALLGGQPASLNARCSIDFQTNQMDRSGPELSHA